MKEQILKDIHYIDKRLCYETSKTNIFVLFASLITLINLLNRISEEEIEVSFSFDYNHVYSIYESMFLKRENRFNDYLFSTIGPNVELSKIIKSKFESVGYYDLPAKSPNRIEDKKSARYLIDFMRSMGDDVYKTFERIYLEDRICVLEDKIYDGMCINASAINSSYVTVFPRQTYHDNATVSHEIGHVIHDKLRYERGIRLFDDMVFIEVLSTYFELIYHDYICKREKDAHSLIELNLRNIKEYITSIDITEKLLQNGYLARYGNSFYSLSNNFSDVSSLFKEDVDVKYYSKLLSGYDYLETTKYFVGNLIGSFFAYNFRDNPRAGLKELKNFLCTSHIGSYEDKINLLGLDSDLGYYDYYLNKSNNLVFRKD